MVSFTLIIIYYMTHLIQQYLMWSAQSQLQVYFFPLMASVFLMLFAYHRAGLDVQHLVAAVVVGKIIYRTLNGLTPAQSRQLLHQQFCFRPGTQHILCYDKLKTAEVLLSRDLLKRYPAGAKQNLLQVQVRIRQFLPGTGIISCVVNSADRLKQ